MTTKTPRSARQPVDMSPAAISQRLRLVAELYRVCRKLQAARRLGPTEDLKAARQKADGSAGP